MGKWSAIWRWFCPPRGRHMERHGAVAATSTYLGTSTLSVTFEELFQRLYFQKQGLNKVSKKKFIFMEKNQSAFTNRLFIKD